MSGTTKQMVCADCGMRINATIAQAKRHRWVVWVGGARCKTCSEKLTAAADPAAVAKPTAPRRRAIGTCASCAKRLVVVEVVLGEWHPVWHWLTSEEHKRRLKEEHKPVPLCPGVRRAALDVAALESGGAA